MVDTASSRVARGLGSADFSPADIVAKTRGNPQEIMKLVMSGQINLTQGFLAKQLADGVVAEQQKAMAPQSTVLQDQFPEMAQAMGAAPPQMPPQGPPQIPPQGMPQMPAQPGMAPAQPGMAPAQPGMAEGGLAQLDFPMPEYADGGIVGYAAGDETFSGIPLELLTPAQRDIAAARAEREQYLPQTTTAADAYKALLGQSDPERDRNRAELAGLFGSFANVRPGMNPLEALAQGFSTTGASMLAGEERAREQELARAEALMGIETAENQTARELYRLDNEIERAIREGADAGRIARLEAQKEELQRRQAVQLQNMEGRSRENAARIQADATLDAARERTTSTGRQLVATARQMMSDAKDKVDRDTPELQMNPVAYNAAILGNYQTQVNALGGFIGEEDAQQLLNYGNSVLGGDAEGTPEPPENFDLDPPR